MSEENNQSAAQASSAENPAGQATAGQLLRQAREARGLHVAALAVALKVSVKKIEAVEADRFDLWPDAVFVRALASSMCRVLKIDPAPVLAQLPQTAVPRLESDAEHGLNTPFHAPGDVSRSTIWNQLSRPVVLVALVLLVGALVLIFFPAMERIEIPVTSSSEPIPAVLAAPPVTSPAPAMLAAPAPEAAPARTPPVAAKPAAVPVTTPVLAPPIATTTAKVPASPAAVAPAAVASSALGEQPPKVKVSSTGIIVFKTRGPSWVEVTDARGIIQISRMIDVGEVVGVSGPLPLSVVVGRADVTDVQVRGKPFALDELAKGNVAHFEVK
jgi:cytoskeleton protein RodZ